MSTPIPAPTQPAGAPRRRMPGRRGVPRWGWVLLTVAAAVVIVALVVVLLGSRGSGSTATSPAGVQPPAPGALVPPAPLPTGPGPLTPGTGARQVDGCLGGHGPDMDAVMLAAQQQAPLTAEGAASLAATFARWSNQTPPPLHHSETTQQIIAPGATLSGLSDVDALGRAGWNVLADTTSGLFRVESFTGTGSAAVAVVTYQVGWSGTKDGAPAEPVVISATLQLTASSGTWRVQDVRPGRSQADMAQVGTAYAGGC